MNTDKLPATTLPSGRNEASRSGQHFTLQDNRPSFANQRHLIQRMSGVVQFGLPTQREVLVRRLIEGNILKLNEMMYDQKLSFEFAFNSILKENKVIQMGKKEVALCRAIFDGIYNKHFQEEEEEEFEEEEEEENKMITDIEHDDPPLFSLEGALVRDDCLILYRSMGKAEFEEFLNTIQTEKIPVFKHKSNGGEKFFATSLAYLEAGMSKKGERRFTVEVLLKKDVMKDLLLNPDLAGYHDSMHGMELLGLNIQQDSSAKKHSVLIKNESEKGSYNITFGFRKEIQKAKVKNSLAPPPPPFSPSPYLAQYIVQVNLLDKPFPKRKSIPNIFRDPLFSKDLFPEKVSEKKQFLHHSDGDIVITNTMMNQIELCDSETINQSIIDIMSPGKLATSLAVRSGLVVVGGDNWLCYIRCVLLALKAQGRLNEVIKILQNQYQGIYDEIVVRGIEIGSSEEEQVRQIILEVTGNLYYVIALNGAHDSPGWSESREGLPIVLLHTGAHFSLFGGAGPTILSQFPARPSV